MVEVYDTPAELKGRALAAARLRLTSRTTTSCPLRRNSKAISSASRGSSSNIKIPAGFNPLFRSVTENAAMSISLPLNEHETLLESVNQP